MTFASTSQTFNVCFPGATSPKFVVLYHAFRATAVPQATGKLGWGWSITYWRRCSGLSSICVIYARGNLGSMLRLGDRIKVTLRPLAVVVGVNVTKSYSIAGAVAEVRPAASESFSLMADNVRPYLGRVVSARLPLGVRRV